MPQNHAGKIGCRASWVVALLTVLPWLCAADPVERPKRSLPPKQWDRETLDRFPENPLHLLKGNRPEIRSGGDTTPGKTPGSGGEPAGGGPFAWSKIISADTVANEIKAHRLDVAEAVKNAGAFKGGGNRQLRREFSVLAVMFGITAEYDQTIRWKQAAAGARDAFARAASNAKAADDNTFNESKARSRDLDELIRGGTVEFPPPRGDVKWNQVAERRLLMSRLDLAHEKRLRPATANAQEFGKNREVVTHEAEIIAALAEVIGREGFEFADDQEYLKNARALRQHAQAVAAAARDNNFGEVQRGVGEITKTCTACHGSFKQ